MRKNSVSRGLVPLFLGACVWLCAPAQALARAAVRFVHAVPSVGRVELSLGQGKDAGLKRVGAIGFGQATSWMNVHSGMVRWALSKGGKTFAHGTTTLGDGAYDIVVLQRGSGVALGVYPAKAGRPGTSLVRVIHAAPQLGSPELTLDGKMAVKRLAFGQATPYVSLPAGHHTLGAVKVGGHTPFLSMGMTSVAGRSASAIVIGSAGQRVRLIELFDRGAPRTVSRATAASDKVSTILVAPGDSLWSIASRLSGPDASNRTVETRLVSIWDKNKARIGTGNPNLIRPGMRLRV